MLFPGSYFFWKSCKKNAKKQKTRNIRWKHGFFVIELLCIYMNTRRIRYDIIHIMSWTAFLNEKMYDRRTIRKSRGNWKSEDSGETENLLAVPVWLREYMHRGGFTPEKRTYEELWMQKTDPTSGKTPRSHRTAVRQACRSGTGSGNGRKMWWRSGAKRIVRRGSRGSSGQDEWLLALSVRLWKTMHLPQRESPLRGHKKLRLSSGSTEKGKYEESHPFYGRNLCGEDRVQKDIFL